MQEQEAGAQVASGIYLDNASTSFPKPDVLWQAVQHYLTAVGASPGRGSYQRAREANRVVEGARAGIATLIGADNPRKVAFTSNATHALNIALRGGIEAGGHVVTTDTEHNSVLRPLESLRRDGHCTYTVVPTSPDGRFDLDRFREAVQDGASLVVVNHASNVTGAVAPVIELAQIAHDHGAAFLLDASQTAGLLDIDVTGWDIDLLALTGHKCLRGPSGTGALYVSQAAAVRHLLVGGSGTNSQSLLHPANSPDKFEAGTANYLGIAGLGEVVRLLTPAVISQRRTTVAELTNYCLDKLHDLTGVTVYDVHPDVPRVPVISIRLADLYPAELCAMLDEQFQIMTRAGLHCAPLIHQTLGTTPHGTLRISLSESTSRSDIDTLIVALSSIHTQISDLAARH